MKRDNPIVITQQPLSRDMAVEGLTFIEKELGLTSTISPRHPLRKWYAEAAKHLSSGITWGPLREFNLLALWGIQLWMVRHWPGFKELIRRIKMDLPTWDAHLHEGVAASMFWLVGCEGEFINPGNKGGPDLKISCEGCEALVECRRSSSLTYQEQKNREIWLPASSQIVHHIREHVPSAFVRFYPRRDAVTKDSELLLQGVEQKIASWHDHHAKNPLERWGYGDLRASDNSFTGRVVVGTEPNELFDAAAEGHPGIEVPDETEPVSLILDLTLSNPPTCDGLWYAKIHTKREWSHVEERVLEHLDEKASQLNRYRRWSPASVKLPSIVWIHHPAGVEATAEELNHLGERIGGKFADDESGRFGAVAATVLTNSRLLLNKHGLLVLQFRFSFISNPCAQPVMYERFPYVTWPWWDAVESGGLPARKVIEKRMWLGSKRTGPNVEAR